MHLAGKVSIRAPRPLVIAALHQADMLAAFLPGDVRVTARDASRFDVEFRRDFGRITVKLRGNLTIHPNVPGSSYHFVMHSKHLLAGSVNLEMTMQFDGKAPTDMSYTGTLTVGGLAARMLAERQDRVQPKLDEMFAGLKQRIEAARAQEARPLSDFRSIHDQFS